MPGVNRQGQAHIVSTASRLRTWFSIDPQPASINPTINIISIVFICAFLVDCGRIICHPAIKNDSTCDPEKRAGCEFLIEVLKAKTQNPERSLTAEACDTSRAKRLNGSHFCATLFSMKPAVSIPSCW
jgi:hypothetical protein